MKEFFENRSLTGNIKIALEGRGTWIADKMQIVASIISIVTDYQKQGYRLTLRQLYYQLVAADLIPNHDKVYKKIGGILDDCRYSGALDWSAIEDRGRVPKLPYSVKDVKDALQDAVDTYRLDRQKGQPKHIELWTEKDAISNILYQVTAEYHVKLVINKGYTSSSAMYQAYTRFAERIKAGQPVTILYFGDHDPSGLDMVRDIEDRLLMFFCNGRKLRDAFDDIYNWWEDGGYNIYDLNLDEKVEKRIMNSDYPSIDDQHAFDIAKQRLYLKEKKLFNVIPIGLTMQQIKQYKLPHNPAKITDPRAADYIKTHGQKSWEVDALRPDILSQLVNDSILNEIDFGIYQKMLKQEESDKKKLKSFTTKK